MKIFFHEKETGTEIKRMSHLDKLLAKASKQAKHKNILSIIFLMADNRNKLGVVVGGDETVLHFSYDHENPPYYVSKGEQDIDEPSMTCFLLFDHHTEFPRKYVIPFDKGLLAIHEFYESVTLPTFIEWVEV
jgi:immunity protein Imm1 of predicted polymorphic toxin system